MTSVSGLRAVEEGEALVEVPATALAPKARAFEFTPEELARWKALAADVVAPREVAGVGID